MNLSPGSRLDHYEIIELIGKGGMGEVYRAKDTRVPRDVAIKVSAAQFSERFARETKIIAGLNHPNICTLYDVGPNYLVMELVEGPTLADRMKEGALSLAEASGIARQVADALEYAHEKGVVQCELEQVFCLETERSISNDWVVRYENRYFQLERSSDYPPRKAKVTVCEWEDGRTEIRYKSKARAHREMEAPPPQPAAIRLVDQPPKQSRWKPPRSHPWRRPAPAMMRAAASAPP